MEEEVLKGKTLLVVDDEVDLRDIVSSELEFMGAKVFQAENISRAQVILEQENIDLIVSDIRMPGGTGIDLLDRVKAHDVGRPPVILITGFADITVEDAFNKGAEALVNKPFKLDDLIKMVVQYTSPYEERFRAPCGQVQKVIERAEEILFGRGGVALRMNLPSQKVDVGEPVRVDLETPGMRIAGEAVCRWLRVSEQGVCLGLEFTFLTPESRQKFREYALSPTLVPYIPSLK